jgi:hypothetical protein
VSRGFADNIQRLLQRADGQTTFECLFLLLLIVTILGSIITGIVRSEAGSKPESGSSAVIATTS